MTTMTRAASKADAKAKATGADRLAQFGTIMAWVVMLGLLFIMIFPLYWVFRTALTSPGAVYRDTAALLPVDPTALNLGRVVGLIDPKSLVGEQAANISAGSLNFMLYLRNSLIVTGLITFGQVIARLTIDANGNNGLSPDFDKDNVVQYGYTGGSMGEAYGQSEWSWLTNTTGWTHNNGVWGDEYYYDDPRFIDTIEWLTSLWLEKGYVMPLEEVVSLGAPVVFQTGQAAFTVTGSWMIGFFLNSDFPVGFARLPEGPEGRKSMFNGLADSIWVGTQHPEEAWEWVKYLGSEACQMVVGESGVVFPAIPAAAAASQQMRADAGVDVSAFVDQAAEPGGTFLFPITDFGSEISVIMGEALDSVGLGQAQAADVIPAANDEVNALFQ